MKTYYKIVIYIVFLIGINTLQAKTIYYVTATGTGDGSSWSNATNSIQPMIDKAASGDEVWVAKGTYYPTTETIARDPRSATFLLKAGVNMYGGFAGTETAISQRTLADLNLDGKVDSCELVNATILSGDIDGVPDVWTKTINADGKTWVWTVKGNEGNCYNVVTGGSLNGFTVIGGNANSANLNNGGGIYSSSAIYCTVSNCSASTSGGGICSSSVTKCTVLNCSAGSSGGGIYSSTVTNCKVSNCSAGNNGGGIYSYSSVNPSFSSYVTNCTVLNCSASNGGGICSYFYNGYYTYVTNCTVSNCSAVFGGGIYSSYYDQYSYYSYYVYVTNCTVSNCYAVNGGGGIFSFSVPSGPPNYTYVTNCTVSNCSTGSDGGGIYSYASSSYASFTYVTNCTVSNCSAGGSSSGGGIHSSSSTNSYVTNCASSNNNTAGTIGSGIIGGTQSNCISPSISDAYIQSTSFIGTAITDAQKTELINANWRLKEGSPCINAGTATNVSSTTLTGKDIDSNPRVLYGTIDIGAYEYIVPTISMPISEKFDTITNWNTSPLFYNSASIKGNLSILWTLVNQKADFSWQTNLTSAYSEPIFTYQIDGTKTSKIYLRYDMYYQAYAGTITPLGTEKLNVEFSTDLITWSTIATYSNANGTIANQTYKYDISTLAAGKTFFIRFNANGANSNRIEKWEIDNVIIDADGLSAVNTVQENKYKYSINDGDLIISNLGQTSLVQLYDVNGRLISAKNSASQMLQFILPTHGVYVVKVTSDLGIENKKVVW
jgi:parallel beta-helix repeat protein